VKGQETAKRALEIAAAGGHNLLMSGPPGAGKSLLASCLSGILPELTPSEALEVSMVQSVAGMLDGGRISRARPFRAPHHSANMATLTGGGLKVKPGEVSLAHLGVLFLDELPEFHGMVELLHQNRAIWSFCLLCAQWQSTQRVFRIRVLRPRDVLGEKVGVGRRCGMDHWSNRLGAHLPPDV
jgi:energy-coupling factor transporter ATP-binding protein EcfA2